VTDRSEKMKFEIKLEKPVVTDEKFRIFESYMKEIHGHYMTSKEVGVSFH
jgi:arginyl-tRNA--protein-N-Asp/Glu arginylyltransferase